MQQQTPTRWASVANLSDLPSGTNRAFRVGGRSILLCHSTAGVYAVENRCTHQLAALEGGKLRGASLFCPKHGAQYDLRTGTPIGPLAKGAIQTFKTRVDEHGNIEIELPGPNGAGAVSTLREPLPLREEPAMSAEQTNKSIVMRFLAEFSSGAVDSTMAMMTDDATWWVAGTMPISGTYDKPAFTRLLSGVLETCTGPIKITPKGLVAEGGQVAVEAESYTQTRSGRTYNNLYHFLFTIRDGKIAGVKEYLDTMHANTILCTP
jgi:ketosteroid isomerase-like protein/nitrite reductase/ring-hydroxylating ferredoxin subunit